MHMSGVLIPTASLKFKKTTQRCQKLWNAEDACVLNIPKVNVFALIIRFGLSLRDRRELLQCAEPCTCQRRTRHEREVLRFGSFVFFRKSRFLRRSGLVIHLAYLSFISSLLLLFHFLCAQSSNQPEKQEAPNQCSSQTVEIDRAPQWQVCAAIRILQARGV